MKAFVTGGSGFVGSHLIELLIAEGHDVRALARSEASSRYIESLGAVAVIGDIEQPESLAGVCNDCDVVYHAAARVDMVGSEADFLKTTVEGTRSMMNAAAASGVRRFVHVSSCGAYHPKYYKAGIAIDENTPMEEPPKWFQYGRAKYFAERVITDDCPSAMDWVIVRLGYVYGPRNQTMHDYVEPAMRDKMMRIVGDGKNPMAFVYVGDVARAILLAGTVEAASRRTLIAGNGRETITQQQYFDALADGFKMKRIRKRAPYWLAYGSGFVFEWWYRFPIRRWFPIGHRATSIRRASVALTGLPQCIDCSETQKVLGWKPTVRFEDGIAKAFDWYQEKYHAG